MSCAACAQRRRAISQRLAQLLERRASTRGAGSRALFVRQRVGATTHFPYPPDPQEIPMSESNYKPTGELQGDKRPIPDRGSTTGMTGFPTNQDGADLGMDATNRIGPIGRQTRSDKGDELIDAGADRNDTRI